MDFSSMSGWDFERYCADCLLKKGFTKAEVTSGSGDHGVDIIAEQNGIRFGIQCKLYQGQIPNKAVQEAYTGASYYDCDIAVIMSNSELTKQADEEARKLRVKFWNIADYIPREDSDKKPFIQCPRSMSEESNPTSYEEYVRIQRKREHELSLKIQKTIECNNQSNDKDAEIAEDYKCWDFVEANEWLLLHEHPWYELTCSVKCYIHTASNIKGQVNKVPFLLGKLAYLDKLNKFIDTFRFYGVNADENIREQFGRVEAILKESAMGQRKANSVEFNEAYWHAVYAFSQMVAFVPMIEQVAASLSDEELAQVFDDADEIWSINNPIVTQVIRNGKNTVLKLRRWWEKLPEEEEVIIKSTGFNLDSIIKEEDIKEHKRLIFDVCYRVNNYLGYAQGLKRKKLEEEKAYINSLKKEIVQPLVERYNTECLKIDSENTVKRKELEKRAQNEIAQAQKQIGELLKQKEAFTLFRKKRDAELDAKIAALDRHIEQVKQNLADELAKCELEVEEKNNNLYERILDEAERSHVKDEVVQAIGK